MICVLMQFQHNESHRRIRIRKGDGRESFETEHEQNIVELKGREVKEKWSKSLQNQKVQTLKGIPRRERKNKPHLNPFHSNVGASRQLQTLGLDVDDPALNKQDFLNEQSLESRLEESKAFRKQWKADEAEQKELAKRKIIRKKMFPKPANPNLLTWIEKETIRILHKQDPVEWSHERLAESFPATPGVIHKVLRGKTITNPEMIAQYNEEVKGNWKLLAKGQLDLDEGYQRHLASSSGTDLPLTQRLLAEQDAVS